MKLRNLFLAGIAVVAMASCSNEVDGIDNGNNGNVEENAVMQFRFSYGNSIVRAVGEAGLDSEQKFTSALLVVDYNDGTTPNVVKSIPRTDFTPISTEENPSTNGKYYQSTPFSVASGAVTAYVILNPTSTITSAVNNLDGKTTDVPTVLKGLELANGEGATDGSFVMYGDGSETLRPDQTTPVTVAVNRIVAKMKEETTTTTFSNIQTGATEGDLDKAVTITLDGYAFTNLTDKSNLVYQNDKKVASFITGSIFDGTAKTYTYQTIGTVDDNTQINYCFENDNVVGNTEGSNITSIIYRAKITATDINDTEETKNANVYIYNNIVYSYTTLTEAFQGLTLGDDATIAQYEALGIRKYEGGACYYRKPITTTGAGNVIKRNNVYKLSVSTVNKIGFPTVIPTTDPTMMLLNLEVNPWTVNENAFDL